MLSFENCTTIEVGVFNRSVGMLWIEISSGEQGSLRKSTVTGVCCCLPTQAHRTTVEGRGCSLVPVGRAPLCLCGETELGGAHRNAAASIAALFPEPRPPMKQFRFRDKGKQTVWCRRCVHHSRTSLRSRYRE